MKITDVKKEGHMIYIITLAPNAIERFFGLKETTMRIKETYSSYSFGGGNVYIYENGKKLGNGHWIGEYLDNWQRKF